MKKSSGYTAVAAAFAATTLLAACGGGSGEGGFTTDSSNARGSLQTNPPLRVTTLSAADLNASLNGSASGRSLLAVAGTPKCGVDFNYLQYGTVGAKGEATNASGALMVPVGADAACTGARPVVLYAHGTTTAKGYNLANVLDSTNAAYNEALLVAAMYAAQGFIVVAPNFAGYDVSKLSYHPYVVADQQSKDMIDALAAARKALPGVSAAESGKLFLTGYSAGGYVAMATHKAMQAAGTTVTASAPMSGPYAVEAFLDAVFYGNVNAGSTVFAPLFVTAYQQAYGNIYTNLTDIYNAPYAAGLDSLLPSTSSVTTLFQQGRLPQSALFSSTPPTAPAGSPASLQATLNAITPPTTPAAQAPLFAAGFGASPLITNSYRLNYLLDAIANPDGAVPVVTTGAPAAAPKHPLRIAAKLNDMRSWTPNRPMLMCAGNADPTVFYSVNTQLMQGFWSAPSPARMATGLLTVLDVDSAPSGANDPYATVKGGFAQAKAQTAQAAVAAGATDGGATAVVGAYHGSLVPPFCNAAARGFFQQVLASGA
ncbi:alpha/beta hydrolase family protein [Piscinibacter sakaiensis]|uniref:alpha/beta hydrolase family protein n=1 Tax=Piscinibacter sakaiensis TaxID=1547922 RepID=UPI003AAA4B7B